ncbi:hypothetical protein ARMGADRAFT_1140819 [Armillaria gallica]|uniref:Mid2 domain-containing protein n=1 Tax=Armillaria gallica TaxID=47427 RepID=A0A2H3D2R9_ARMGA|nr:hypothetical protein ARMGADRAFT_1140819 [Armillaria gallica]
MCSRALNKETCKYCTYEIFHALYDGYEPYSFTPRQQPPGGVIPEDATPYYFVYILHGFHFENFSGTVTAGIPITLSWHRNVNGPNHMDFALENATGPFVFLDAYSFSLTNLTQLSGTLDVTFPESGEYVIEARINQTAFPACTQTFDVKDAVTSKSVNSVTSSVTETGKPSSSTTKSIEGTVTAPPNGPTTQSVPSTVTGPPMSNSTHRKRKTPIIIGGVIGALVPLLLIFGGGTFLFIRRRRHRGLRDPLSPNPKILPELNSIHSHLPPVGNKNSRQTISPILAGEMPPNLGSGSREPVQESPEGNPTEDERERRNSIGTPVDNEDSEAQSPREREESPQAPLDDVEAEVLRLRDQVQRLVERVQGNAFDPPPAYA